MIYVCTLSNLIVLQQAIWCYIPYMYVCRKANAQQVRTERRAIDRLETWESSTPEPEHSIPKWLQNAQHSQSLSGSEISLLANLAAHSGRYLPIERCRRTPAMTYCSDPSGCGTVTYANARANENHAAAPAFS